MAGVRDGLVSTLAVRPRFSRTFSFFDVVLIVSDQCGGQQSRRPQNLTKRRTIRQDCVLLHVVKQHCCSIALADGQPSAC